MTRVFRPTELAAVAESFDLPGRPESVAPHGHGHINDTFLHVRRDGAVPRRFILQRINTAVFRDPDALMENVRRVTAHAARRLAEGGAAGPRYEILEVLPTRAGAPLHRDPDGGCWRCFPFIEDVESHEVLLRPEQAHAAARAFGRFQGLVADLPLPRLHETIPEFHDTPGRLAALERAVAADPRGRARLAAPEIAAARERHATAGRLLARHARGEIPERITHNDTKLNNVLLDRATGHGAAVIDLDTVMPGLAPYDFGDLVRTATNTAPEDETDLARVAARPEVFAAAAEGYLETARGFLTAAEVEELPFAGRLLTFENGVRFLTDFLQGDTYFKTARPDHNLDRCRAQFALLRSMEAQAPDWEALVRRLA